MKEGKQVKGVEKGIRELEVFKRVSIYRKKLNTN